MGVVKDAAKLLGVATDASEKELKAARHKLFVTQNNHPDRGGDKEKSQKILAAFEMLMKRAKIKKNIDTDVAAGAGAGDGQDLGAVPAPTELRVPAITHKFKPSKGQRGGCGRDEVHARPRGGEFEPPLL
jgi:DnaJ-class molecular chaperone